MSYLADTTLFIDYYRKVPKAKEYIDKLRQRKISISISVITESEIWVGIKNDKEMLYWEALLSFITKIPVNSEIAREAGVLYRRYGHYMGKVHPNDLRHLPDALIAATAKITGKKLITSNYSHFKQLEWDGHISCESYSKHQI